ncbi:hypothetical protein V1478_014378 [Vespula squamosa]|uniref:Uncharacterized protein n=1 Tax=Vespula squamosa TaxID=30214 RepID=A0ABD2A7U7_VESSQ
MPHPAWQFIPAWVKGLEADGRCTREDEPDGDGDGGGGGGDGGGGGGVGDEGGGTRMKGNIFCADTHTQHDFSCYIIRSDFITIYMSFTLEFSGYHFEPSVDRKTIRMFSPNKFHKDDNK